MVRVSQKITEYAIWAYMFVTAISNISVSVITFIKFHGYYLQFSVAINKYNNLI